MTLEQRYNEYKAKHPDVMVLVKEDGYMTTFADDAVKLGELLKKKVEEACFPDKYHFVRFKSNEVNKVLPKLIAAGQRVAFIDKEKTAEEESEVTQDIEPFNFAKGLYGIERKVADLEAATDRLVVKAHEIYMTHYNESKGKDGSSSLWLNTLTAQKDLTIATRLRQVTAGLGEILTEYHIG